MSHVTWWEMCCTFWAAVGVTAFMLAEGVEIRHVPKATRRRKTQVFPGIWLIHWKTKKQDYPRVIEKNIERSRSIMYITRYDKISSITWNDLQERYEAKNWRLVRYTDSYSLGCKCCKWWAPLAGSKGAPQLTITLSCFSWRLRAAMLPFSPWAIRWLLLDMDRKGVQLQWGSSCAIFEGFTKSCKI